MNSKTKLLTAIMLSALVGGAGTYGVLHYLGLAGGASMMSAGDMNGETAASDEKGADEPLYWVAPMDPNYRRDKPGKSPMGMDLVPVYKDDAEQAMGAGTVKIAPEVVNNLGVRTAEVEMKPLNTRITTVGYVGYDENQLIHIHPRVEGWVEKLYPKAEGESVRKDQPLYTFMHRF